MPTCSAIVTACGTEHWGKAYGSLPGPYVRGDVVQVYCSTGYTNTGTGQMDYKLPSFTHNTSSGY